MVPTTAIFLTPARLPHMPASTLRVIVVKTVAAEPELDANDPLEVASPPPPGMAKPSSPPPFRTTCERELASVVSLKAALCPKRAPFHDTANVAGAPVPDKVAQFKGLAENRSLTVPEVIDTPGFDAPQYDNRPLRCEESGTASNFEALGENDTVPTSRHVTWPGAAPRYLWARATAGPALTPRDATTTTVAANTIGAIGLRRMETFWVSTVPLRPGRAYPGPPIWTLDRDRAITRIDELQTGAGR
jgi:hypothetical protein